MPLLLILCLLLPASVRAQTLAEALERALIRHPQEAALTAEEAAARARIDLARSLTPAPPELSVANLNDRLHQNRGKDEWELELAVPLWLPGQQGARQAEADQGEAEVLARRQALRLDLAGELREAWWALADARQAEELARRRVATARALTETVDRRYRAGDLARVDANLARSEVLAAEAELLEAEGRRQTAEGTYAAAVGLPAPAQLPGEAEPPGGLPEGEHPRLAALATAGRLARARLKVAEEVRRDAPELAVRLVRERSGFTEAYGSALGLKLTVPFASGPRSRQDSALALAEASRAEAELVLARQRLALDRQRARQALALARQQRTMAAERHRLATDSLALGEKAFALGESDLPSLLRLRSAAHEAESLLGRSGIAEDLALSRYRQTLGVLP